MNEWNKFKYINKFWIRIEDVVKKDDEMGGIIPGGNFHGEMFLEPI